MLPLDALFAIGLSLQGGGKDGASYTICWFIFANRSASMWANMIPGHGR